MSWRVVEFFAGMGGWRYALPQGAGVAAAYDISPAALATYALNHQDAPRARELATLPALDLQMLHADTWVMSPPCQPYCRMGKQEDVKDPRSRAFLRLLELWEECRPARLALENVEGFVDSEAYERLMVRLEGGNYNHRTLRVCPTQAGIPNLRPRVFVVAAKDPLLDPEPLRSEPLALSGFLDDPEDSELYLAETQLRHLQGLDLAAPEDLRSACFIGGYGQRFVGSGSFLQTPKGVRRFSPTEIARLMGLPESFRFPQTVSLEKRYKLLGNGLSIPVARWVLSHLPH
jgi:DNA (cytosine-5)-methyltransferase 1